MGISFSKPSFFDLSIRLPEPLRIYESEVRESLNKKLHRGKVEATLRFTTAAHAQGDVRLNEAIVQKLAGASDIVQLFSSIQIDLSSILLGLGFGSGNAHYEAAAAEALVLLQQSIHDLVQMRRREGPRSKNFLSNE